MEIALKTQPVIKTNIIATYLLLTAFFFFPASTTISQILYYLSLVFILISSDWKKRVILLKQSPLAISILAFALIIATSMIYSDAPHYLKWHIFTKYIWLIALPFVLVSVSNDLMQKFTIPIFLTQTLITLALSYIHIFQTHFNLLHILHIGFGNASVFKGHITQNILFSFAFFICLQRFFQNSKNKYVYLLFATALLINTLFFSSGRAGYIMMPLISLCFFWQHFGRIKALVIGIISFAAILSAGYLISPIVQKRVSTAITESKAFFLHKGDINKTSMGVRLRDSHIVIWIFKQHPIAGRGMGTFLPGTKDYIQAHHLKPFPNYTALSDSAYLNLLCQNGLIGLISFFCLLGLFLYYARKLPTEQKQLLQAIVLAIFVLSVNFTWLTNNVMRGILTVFLTYFFALMAQKVKTIGHK